MEDQQQWFATSSVTASARCMNGKPEIETPRQFKAVDF
jgi:hypothetical protein